MELSGVHDDVNKVLQILPFANDEVRTYAYMYCVRALLQHTNISGLCIGSI